MLTLELTWSSCVLSHWPQRKNRRGVEDSLPALHKSDGTHEHLRAHEAQHEYHFITTSCFLTIGSQKLKHEVS